MRRIRSPCCARAASGHAAAPPSSVMNSRRFMPRPQHGGYHIVAGNVALCIAAKCSADRLLRVKTRMPPECSHVSFRPAADKPHHGLYSAMCHKPTYAVQQKVPYSITSSAVASSVGGTVRPSILAVSWLMTSSNLLACTTGRSAGLAPLRMRPV